MVHVLMSIVRLSVFLFFASAFLWSENVEPGTLALSGLHSPSPPAEALHYHLELLFSRSLSLWSVATGRERVSVRVPICLEKERYAGPPGVVGESEKAKD